MTWTSIIDLSPPAASTANAKFSAHVASLPSPTAAMLAPDFAGKQGLKLLHVRAQLEQLQDTFMIKRRVTWWTEELKLT